MLYRDMKTGAYPITAQDLIAAHPDYVFPEVWDADLLNFLGVDPVEEVEPPEVPIGYVLAEAPPGFYGVWRQRWQLVALPVEEWPDPIEKLRAARLAELANKRWEFETGGMVLGLAVIATDRQSQSLLNGALALVTADPSRTIDWKTDSGWVSLDAATIQQIAFAVGAHVQAAFSRERVLAEEILAAETLDGIAAIALTFPGGG